MTRYDSVYSDQEAYFGPEPNPLLVRFEHLLDIDGKILDVGAGQGRHALHLARKGFAVDAVEPSRVAAEKMNRIAERESLKLRAHSVGFESYEPDEPASGILLFGIIPDLSRPQIADLAGRVKAWSREGGVVIVAAQTTLDPAYGETPDRKLVDHHSFGYSGGRFYTYLEAGEILRFFEDFEVIHHWEGFGPEHPHGDGPPEHHGVAHAIFRK